MAVFIGVMIWAWNSDVGPWLNAVGEDFDKLRPINQMWVIVAAGGLYFLERVANHLGDVAKALKVANDLNTPNEE